MDKGKSKSRPQSVKTFASADDDFHNGNEWAGSVKDPWDPCILTLGESNAPCASAIDLVIPQWVAEGILTPRHGMAA